MVYKRIKELRLEKGWTAKEVAEKLGCHVSTYRNYENGKRQIPTEKMMHLSYLYDVSFHYMVDLTDHRTPNKICTFEEWKEAMGLIK